MQPLFLPLKKSVAPSESDPSLAEAHSIWVKFDSNSGAQKLAHKKTVLRTFMDPTLDIDSGKTHDRLMSVRCYSDKDDRASTKIHSHDIGNDNLLRLQGLFATLISFNVSEVSMAILQCTGIKITNTHPPTSLDAAPIAEISLPETRYEVTGQILSLVPFVASDRFQYR
ncbi:hypothetical protein B0H14DRAFT_2563914 [Mycena olivaceomarginata]|nr:hypothetical protein B0H14DRAFT_2563914 [Mycena olivaceomarginata]